MANNAINVALLGSTGLVVSYPPATLSSTPNPKLTTLIETDTSRWANHISQLSSPPTIFISSLGTTRSQAGSLSNQYNLELATNIECAKAARDAGAKVYVLVSSGSANSSSVLPYLKLKGEIEEAAKELGFEHTVFLRPGVITAGQRGQSRPFEAVVRFVASSAGKIHSSLKDGWAQDADDIAKAGVIAGLKALAGEAPAGKEKVWVIEQGEIARLVREG